MLTWQRSISGAILATAGVAAALLAASAETASAGPFQWLTGKNQQQQQQQQQQQPGGNPGFFPFFGGRGGSQGRAAPDAINAPHADELPRDDPEAMLITNPALS